VLLAALGLSLLPAVRTYRRRERQTAGFATGQAS
jgi:hypothetical protein